MCFRADCAVILGYIGLFFESRNSVRRRLERKKRAAIVAPIQLCAAPGGTVLTPVLEQFKQGRDTQDVQAAVNVLRSLADG
jgi:hypothetical protein